MTPERTFRVLATIIRILTAPFVRYEISEGCARGVTSAVVAVNHRSMFDVAAGLVCLERLGHRPRLLVERRYVEGRWTAPFAKAIGAIPVDRHKGGGTSFGAAVEALRAGIPIVVLPEGKLHWDPERPRAIGPTRTGVSRLARTAGVPVVPTALSGTERVMPAHARLPRLNPFEPKTVHCRVADEPIWLTSDDHRANTDMIMATVSDLMVD